MAKDQRFEKVYSQGMLETTEIWVYFTPVEMLQDLHHCWTAKGNR